VIILVGLALELVIELGGALLVVSKKVGEDGWQCLEHSIFQSGNENAIVKGFGDGGRDVD